MSHPVSGEKQKKKKDILLCKFFRFLVNGVVISSFFPCTVQILLPTHFLTRFTPIQTVFVSFSISFTSEDPPFRLVLSQSSP